MKTVKTTTKLLLTLVLGLVMSYQLKATDKEIDPAKAKAKAEAKAIAEVVLDRDIDALEMELMEAGVFECTDMQMIIIIGEDDEIVFRGTADYFGGSNKDLKNWTNKADFLTTIGNTSYYKVF